MGNTNICPINFFNSESENKNQINPLKLDIDEIEKNEFEENSINNTINSINNNIQGKINNNIIQNNNNNNDNNNESSISLNNNSIKEIEEDYLNNEINLSLNFKKNSNNLPQWVNDFEEINTSEPNDSPSLSLKHFSRIQTTYSNNSTSSNTMNKINNVNSNNNNNNNINNNININNEENCIILNKIILIQRTYKDYILCKKERLYEKLCTINTTSVQKVDKKNKPFLSHLKLKYTIIYPKNIRKHEKEGFCILKWKDHSLLYGIYHNNKLNGYVRMKLQNNSEYHGKMKNNKFDNFGIFYSNNHSKLIGFWKEGKLTGEVIEKIYDDKFYGEYKNGVRCGIGQYIYNDGSVYYGEFKDNKYDGFGYLKYANGKLYEGEFKRNLFNGYGEFTYNSNEKYYGMWLNGKKNIFGIYVNKNKKICFIGFWKDNNQNGIGAVYTENKVRFDKWENGKKIKSYNSYEIAMKNIPNNYQQYKDFFFPTRESATILFY